MWLLKCGSHRQKPPASGPQGVIAADITLKVVGQSCDEAIFDHGVGQSEELPKKTGWTCDFAWEIFVGTKIKGMCFSRKDVHIKTKKVVVNQPICNSCKGFFKKHLCFYYHF